MTQLRVLIVDDEPLARQRMRTLLQQHDDVEIVGECANGLQARQAIVDRKPDLVFLDIQMPRLDGFEVVGSLPTGDLPRFVFVTAFRERAVDAFEVDALDYLLKPFDAERLQRTLDRARSKSAAVDSKPDSEQLVNAIEQATCQRHLERVAVNAGGRVQLVPVGEIQWIEAAGNYLRVHCDGRDYLLRQSMKRLQDRLAATTFARIHRSYIVNLTHVESFEPTLNGDYWVWLKSGQRLPLSRNYRSVIRTGHG